MRALVRLSRAVPLVLVGFVPECLQLRAAICQPGAEFHLLRLQLVNVLVENGSTQLGGNGHI